MAALKSIKQAVILAGGLGARLRPLTDTLPKPMIRLNSRPFLEYLIGMLRDNGITNVVLLLGYLPEKITEYFGDGSRFGIGIQYSIGAISDETGTRIRNAANLLDDHFLLLYADNYWPANVPKMFSFYKKSGALASTTVYNNKDGCGEYGRENNISVTDDGFVLKYDKKRQDLKLNGVDIGFFILNKKILDIFPAHNFSFETEILPILANRHQLIAYRTDHPYYFITAPKFIKKVEKFLKEKKIIFIDRDGVINKKMPEHDYVKHWKEFEFLPGAIEALRLLTENNYLIYIITNQRGIARGLINEDDLKAIHRNMKEELKKNGAIITGIYYCPHDYSDGCECRKPKPGLFLRAARENCIDLTKAIFISDDKRDERAGIAAECKTILLKKGDDLLSIVKKLI